MENLYASDIISLLMLGFATWIAAMVTGMAIGSLVKDKIEQWRNRR